MFSAQPRTAIWQLHSGGGGISTGPVSERPFIVLWQRTRLWSVLCAWECFEIKGAEEVEWTLFSFMEGRTETVFMGLDSMLWAEERTGSRASWAQRGEAPSHGSSGWLWVQAYKSIAKESLPCCEKLMWSPWKTFSVLPCGRGAVDFSPRGQAAGTTQLEGSCGMPSLYLCTALPRLQATFRGRPHVSLATPPGNMQGRY